MDRPYSYRFLRITVSVICGLLCFVFAELWVRSYQWETTVQGVIGTERVVTRTASGRLELLIFPNAQSRNFPKTSWSRQSHAPSSFQPRRPVWKLHRLRPNGISIAAPHWFLVLMFGSIAAAPWLPRRLPRKFSLRTLLIATAVVAVLLGVAMAVSTRGGMKVLAVPTEDWIGFIPFLVLAVPISLLVPFLLFAVYMVVTMVKDRRRSDKR
jgi:hypothetical protein